MNGREYHILQTDVGFTHKQAASSLERPTSYAAGAE